MLRLAMMLTAAGLGLLAGEPSGSAPGFAPLDRPGPPLSVPVADLELALSCPYGLAPGRETVLLVPGTATTPDESFGWNAMEGLDGLGRPWCAVTVPQFTNGDIQVAAEYVVHALRRIAGATGGDVDIVGWSQGGGPLPRFALRFWPDVRNLVDDFVAFAPSNHGTLVAEAACAVPCVSAVWQQHPDAALIAAVNSGRPTFPGISYSVIYTRADEIVFPNATGSSSVLAPGPETVNIAVQDLCPADPSEHHSILGSAAGWALAVDALTHPGPADPARLDPAQVCPRLVAPFTTPDEPPLRAEQVYRAAGPRLMESTVPREPPLRCYVIGDC